MARHTLDINNVASSLMTYNHTRSDEISHLESCICQRHRCRNDTRCLYRCFVYNNSQQSTICERANSLLESAWLASREVDARGTNLRHPAAPRPRYRSTTWDTCRAAVLLPTPASWSWTFLSHPCPTLAVPIGHRSALESIQAPREIDLIACLLD